MIYTHFTSKQGSSVFSEIPPGHWSPGYPLLSGKQGSYALPVSRKGAGALATQGQRFKIWQPGFYDYNIYSPEKFNQKLNYIHKNPVKHNVTLDIAQYRFCSWRNYELGDHSIFKIDYLT